MKESLFTRLGRQLAREQRGFICTALSEFFALAYHICFLVFFFLHGIKPMFYFNIFSVLFFIAMIFMLFMLENVKVVFFITVFEVVLHQVLADYFLGALAGFHFLIMILVVFPYLIEKEDFHIGVPTSLVCMGFFLGCELVFSLTEPVYVLEPDTLRIVRFVNIAASMTVLLTLIIIFKLIIGYIENSMETLNQKNEELLENILPRKVVKNLREQGHTRPEMFSDVSILFTDIVSFTSISRTLSPAVLIEELNDIFTNFDMIMDKHECVRIKTIGDAYMAVCGVPEKNVSHTRNLMDAALECRDYLAERNRTAAHKWEIRLGIHTGTVVAGIVGVKKYIYDIFGDTVNVASRMETNSEPMRLCVSQSVYNSQRGHFKFEDRGEKEIKGKGLMKLYFAERL